ncbi:MAG: TVP38/TMEM64 family protein [Clostridiales bacterium]|nr:TVP38/TMEM64 family protein [Clostridiales bacterium]
MPFFDRLYELIMTLINYMGIYGPLLGCVLICVESIIPVLPLSVFITINFISFGSLWGFLISWLFTILGCSLSFFLFRHYLRDWFVKKTKDTNKVRKLIRIVEKAKFQNIVLFLAIPFTPAFLVNIAASLSNISYKKFFYVILISKVFLVYFWGYVGTTLLESFIHPEALVKVILISIIAYVLSLLINKKLKLD